ncbi:MAG: L-lactate permease, partial [Candidatus Cyclobacteriaceae bacterium M3_2C_046]
TLSLLVAGVSVFFFIYKFLRQDEGKAPGKSGWILYLAIMIPFFVLSSFLLELSGLVAAIFMAAVAYIFLFQNKKIPWQPWTPYLFLVLLLLIPKIFPWFSDFLKSYTFQFTNLYGLDVNASLQPFSSPLIPFLLAAAFALYRVRNFRIDLKPVVSKTFTVFLVLFPSLAITQLMLSKSPEFPSMIDALAGMFVAVGDFYPLFSPVIGVLGAFITGSTTVSNIIFGSVQNSTALSLNLNPDIILSLQLAGASLGNAICLFNIIAAAAVAGVENYGEILRKNLLPVLIASLIIAGVGYLLINF